MRKVASRLFQRTAREGSYLNDAAQIAATHVELPPWAGRYGTPPCAPGAGGCGAATIDVAIGEAGWEARIVIEAQGRTQTLAASGEEGEELSLGPYLALQERGTEGERELLRLVRDRAGSVQVRAAALAGRIADGPATVERPAAQRSR